MAIDTITVTLRKSAASEVLDAINDRVENIDGFDGEDAENFTSILEDLHEAEAAIQNALFGGDK